MNLESFKTFLDGVRRDWEDLPSYSKFSIFASIFLAWAAAWYWSGKTNKLPGFIWLLAIVAVDVLLLIWLRFIRPRYLRAYYSYEKFLGEDPKFEIVIHNKGVWELVNHKRKTIRWIVNVDTVYDLGLLPFQPAEIDTNFMSYLKTKAKNYTYKSPLMTTGRSPGFSRKRDG